RKEPHNAFPKLCFVTVGATAPFRELVLAVLAESFVERLSKSGFTHLTVQYGRDEFEEFEELVANLQSLPHGITIEAFDFKDDLGPFIRLAMTGAKVKRQAKQHCDPFPGLMITHAGTGSILEGLRSGVPLIIVPNSKLAGNHQEDVAAQMEKLGYGIASAPDKIEHAFGRAVVQRAHRFSPTKSMDQHFMNRSLGDQLSFVD
ncbi:hypothetical protein N7466_005070, partial [Penicillium verhagenii]|uniref:uncharacterized protein n=1 Tax=Penicillium verhagenii TaxID=1562060 RepID=UPI002545ABCB